MKLGYQQFLLLFITTVLVTLIYSLTIYETQKDALIKEVFSHLESVSEAKENRLKGIIESRKELVIFLATNPSIVQGLKDYIQTKNHDYLKNIKPGLNRYIKEIPSFEKVHILTLDGEIVASSDSNNIGSDWGKNENFLISRKGKRFLSNIHKDTKGNFHYLISAPIYANKKIIGVAMVDHLANELLSLTQAYGSLGETGETALAKKINDKIYYLTPLRFDSTAALKRNIHESDTTIAMGKVFKEKKDILFIAQDYRGKEVLASGRYLPETNWGMITKMDLDEVMQPVYKLRKVIIVFNVFAIILSIMLAFLAGEYFALPIRELIQSTNKIKAGDLTVRATESNKIYELGVLAKAFNEMAKRLQKKIEQLDKYAYIISHDLKAPLNAIEGLIFFIKEDYKDNPLDKEGEEMLGMMNFKVQDMKLMIDNILKTAKEENKVKEPVSLHNIAQEVIHTLNAPSHFHFFIQHNLPTVFANRTSIIQIFQNLIGNAIKYMDKKQPLIKLGFVNHNKYYQFCVTDNGPGISKEKQENIFNIFEIGHQNDQIESHGLGLSIVKQLVEELGGKIWVESEPENETHFYFTIPKV